MNQSGAPAARSLSGLWAATIACGFMIFLMVMSLTTAYSTLERLEKQVSEIQQQAALGGQADARENLRRHQMKQVESSIRALEEQANNVQNQLNRTERRLSALDGKARNSRDKYDIFPGSGRQGIVGGLEDRIEKLETSLEQIKSDVEDLDSELNYNR